MWTRGIDPHSTMKGNGVTLHVVHALGPSDFRQRHFVLLHGLRSCAFTWEETIPSLGNYGTIWAMDLPGYGHSELLASNPSCSNLLDPFCHFLTSLKGEVILIGHSMGARYLILALSRLNWTLGSHLKITGIVIEDMDMEPFFLPKPLDPGPYWEGFVSIETLKAHLRLDGYFKEKIRRLDEKGHFYQKKGLFFSRVHPGIDQCYQTYVLEHQSTLTHFKAMPHSIPLLVLGAERKSCISEKGLRNMQEERTFHFSRAPLSGHSIHRDAPDFFLRSILRLLTVSQTL
jgi:pimeloyl-ACP methyl ester carboxylesterase